MNYKLVISTYNMWTGEWVSQVTHAFRTVQALCLYAMTLPECRRSPFQRWGIQTKHGDWVTIDLSCN